MENENIFFDYVDSTGVTKKAEVLTLFNVEGSNKTYALCSVPSVNDTYEIMTFYVNSISQDEVSFEDITDQEELKKVMTAANDIING